MVIDEEMVYRADIPGEYLPDAPGKMAAGRGGHDVRFFSHKESGHLAITASHQVDLFEYLYSIVMELEEITYRPLPRGDEGWEEIGGRS